jgi:hypothetical protein
MVRRRFFSAVSSHEARRYRPRNNVGPPLSSSGLSTCPVFQLLPLPVIPQANMLAVIVGGANGSYVGLAP